jgi:hypothetical protein
MPSLTLNPVSEKESLGGINTTEPVLGTLDALSIPDPEPPQETIMESKPRLTPRKNLLTQTPIKFID